MPSLFAFCPVVEQLFLSGASGQIVVTARSFKRRQSVCMLLETGNIGFRLCMAKQTPMALTLHSPSMIHQEKK